MRLKKDKSIEDSRATLSIIEGTCHIFVTKHLIIFKNITINSINDQLLNLLRIEYIENYKNMESIANQSKKHLSFGTKTQQKCHISH